MFKILVLRPSVDDDLQEIQNEWEVEAVTPLGSQFVIVQYDTPTPGTTNAPSGSSGSVPDSSLKAAKKK